MEYGIDIRISMILNTIIIDESNVNQLIFIKSKRI